MTVHIMLTPPRKPTTVPADLPPGPGVPITHLTHQWLTLYNRGKKTFPPLAGASASAFMYLAWALRETHPSRACGYAAAATATLCIVPFTILGMHRVNSRLTGHATRDDKAVAEGREAMKLSEAELARREREDAEALGLLRRWACLNLVRGTLPLVGAVLGVYAAVFA